jgi:hypothetical protein
VYPLLRASERGRADDLLDGYFSALADDLELRVVHADL